MKAFHKSMILSAGLLALGFMGYSTTLSAAPDLATQVRELTVAVKALNAVVATHEKTIAALTFNNEGLKKRLACVSTSSTGKDVIFEGCNVHVRNGLGATNTTNSYGNLIVGYNHNEVATRVGSHNLVLGDGHEYTSYGGIVSGSDNSLTAPNTAIVSSVESSAAFRGGVIIGANKGVTDVNAVIVGGTRNYAAPGALFGVVIGGTENMTYGNGAVAVGGVFGNASGSNSVICGGSENNATGAESAVSGGSNNSANGVGSSVSGGWRNTADGDYSSILGGTNIVVSANYGTSP